MARHENELSGTTDVAAHPEFASRSTSRTIDGSVVSGWFTEDFTLAELKTLRARERLPEVRPANIAYDDRYEIPTFQELVDLVRRRAAGAGRPVGIYLEMKHASYFDAIGLSLEKPVLEALERHRLPNVDTPVFIQSFEVANLRALSEQTSVPLIQLISATSVLDVTPPGLAAIADYAAGIGADKELVIPRDAAGTLSRPTTLVADAHATGLRVDTWTLRAENAFLPTDLRRGHVRDPGYGAQLGNWQREYAAFLAAGVDGVFADQPDLAVAARSEWLERRHTS